MTKTPENTTDSALQAEIDRLRGKNTELLAELKAAKAAATDAQTALEAAHGERDAALADVRALRLDKPVAALLADVAVDADLFAQLFARHFTFAVAEDGGVVIHDTDGNPAQVQEPGSVTTGGNARTTRPDERSAAGKARPATFTAADVEALARATPDAGKFAALIPDRASGGGATGSRGGSVPAPSTPAQPAASPASPYGLR